MVPDRGRPDSFSRKTLGRDLCRKIGLGDQLIGSNDADRKTYIVVKNKLVVMARRLMFMVPTKFCRRCSRRFLATHQNAHGRRVVPSPT